MINLTLNKTLYSITFLLSLSLSANAGWLDKLTEKADKVTEKVTSNNTSKLSDIALSNDKITNGLKQALSKGADFAVSSLGKTGGFINDKNVRIPMPEKLGKIESLLRKSGKGKYADEFVATMNSAAEAAVPLTIDILKDGIQNMSVDDAKNILSGKDDAATQYLRKVGDSRLQSEITPIVKKATAKAGVTRTYKIMYEKIGFAGKYLNLDDYDIDSYVTKKTMDGLFTMIAQEEKKIRANPVERTTDVLKEVFGSL